MYKKRIGLLIVVASIILFIVLTISDNSPSFKDLCISSEEWNNIISTRTATDNVSVELLNFNGYDLFYDEQNNRWYYSIIENGTYDNPIIRYKLTNSDSKLFFLETNITTESIEKNEIIKIIVYNEKEYNIYELTCTTLPLLNITYDNSTEIIQDEKTKMQFYLFDNRIDATRRVINSNGTIHVRGASTTAYPKKGYRISLNEESLGDNIRKNKLSLLGMRQDSEWLLYAGYNDQEKIRNVFSSNLWMESCAKNNSFGITNGMEYRYIELFFNGEYWGLYALGFPIDEYQLNLNTKSLTNKQEEFLFKKTKWSTDLKDGYELKSNSTDESIAWEKLQKFYETMTTSTDIEKLYKISDIQNAIDAYLFFNFIQGGDNVGNDLKNIYLAIKNKDNQDIIIYTPWDLDLTFGNTWDEIEQNNTIFYKFTEEENFIMECNVITYLKQLGDTKINELIKERYSNLRKTYWSTEYLDKMIDQFEKNIYDSGAYERDKERWVDGTYGESSDKLDIFRNYVKKRLNYLDLYIEENTK